MQADIFYTTTQDNALPLIMVDKADLEQSLETATAFERNSLNVQQFKGNYGDVALFNNSQGLVDKVYIGLGDGNEVQALAHAAVRLPGGKYTSPSSLSIHALVIWSLAQYRFDAYKEYTGSLKVLAVNPQELEDILPQANAIYLVRDLINMPANLLGPQDLGKVVASVAQEYGAEFQEWVGDDLLTYNFPAIHAVGRAGEQAPRMLSLTWGDVKHPKISLVGKGVCFDSGGLDIKTAAGMRLMKKDMGGAAHALGLGHWIMSKRLPVRLQILIPAVENGISNQAYRPGDILSMRNGLKVEIDNTDAEGRLVLADALVKACEEKPDLLIDFATLTGAARIAVGTEISAMFSNHDELANKILAAAESMNDPVWRLPLYKGYEVMLESPIADLANSSPSHYAGAILAGLFLQRFIDPSLPWLHFDIMAWNIGNKPGKPEGGEAMGIRAVAEYLFNRYG